MHALLLRFLGSFAQLQDFLDTMVAKRFLDRRMPAAGKFFWHRAVKRIRDDERVTLFLAIAKDLESDADLDAFKGVFDRVKDLRDGVAHSARIVHAEEDDVLMIDKSIITALGEPPQRVTVDRAQLLLAIRECGWLDAQANYVVHSGGLYEELRLGAVLMVVPKPASTPEEWNGVTYEGADESSTVA